MSFSFTFGSYHELRGHYYIEYPLEALLYDASMGVFVSRYLIFDYFTSRIQAGENVPAPILQFVAANIGTALEKACDGQSKDPGRILFRELLNPKGEKRKTAGAPFINDMIDFMGDEGDIHNRLEAAGNRLRMSRGAVSKQYYRQKARSQRISAVQQILETFYADDPDGKTGWKAIEKLKEIYLSDKNLY